MIQMGRTAATRDIQALRSLWFSLQRATENDGIELEQLSRVGRWPRLRYSATSASRSRTSSAGSTSASIWIRVGKPDPARVQKAADQNGRARIAVVFDS